MGWTGRAPAPRSASWIEEMEKRSRRRTRDLVTQPAYQGLSENENGCVRTSMMAKSMNALLQGRIQKRKTNPLRHSDLACNNFVVPATAASPQLADIARESRSGRKGPEH
jgi:hypothetical protein